MYADVVMSAFLLGLIAMFCHTLACSPDYPDLLVRFRVLR